MKTSSQHSLLQTLPVAELLLIAIAIVWGFSYGMAKIALIYYPVFGFLALRFGLSFIFLLPNLKDFHRPEIKNAFSIGVPLGLILLAIFVFETYGLKLTTATNASFLISTTVIFTPLVEWLILRQRPTSFTVVAASVSLFGAALLCQNLNTGFNSGDLLMLCAAVVRAFFMVYSNKKTKNQQLSTLALTAVQSAVLMLGFGFLALALDGFGPNGLPALPVSLQFWGAILFLVLFCTLFAFVAQNYAIRRSSPTKVALILGIEPAFGALFAILFLGEQLSMQTLLGGVLIITASLASSLQQHISCPKIVRQLFA